MKYFAVIVLLVVLSSSWLTAQHNHKPAARPAVEKKAVLMKGVGALEHPVSTKNSLAQRFFNQGLALSYAFNHDESIRAFKRAAELDPNLAMAYWGIALASGPNYNIPDMDPQQMKTAVEALEKAQKLAVNASENERSYINALSKRYVFAEQKPDLKKLSSDYSNAMKEVHERFPDDLDAAVLYVESVMNLRPWQLWSNDGEAAEGTKEIMAILESVLKRDSNHIGANHLYIHVVEASPNPERGLPSAYRLESLAPGAGHLVHMPAHIYMRIGEYRGATKSNAVAAQVDREYIRRTGVQGVYPLFYYNHNLHFMAASASMEGAYATAKNAADQLAVNARKEYKTMAMIEPMAAFPMLMMVRFNRWSEIMRTPEPPSEMSFTRATWHYARAVAQTATGKLAQAQAEQRLFNDAASMIPKDSMVGLNTSRDVLSVAAHVLEGRLATGLNNHDKAAESYKAAIKIQDQLRYDEPPGFYYPVRESLGAALLRKGNAPAAEKVFREDLKINPRNGRSLYGLMHALRQQQREADARWVETEYKRAWKNADSKLSLDTL